MLNNKEKKYKISFYYLIALKNLISKYNSFEYSFSLICINNIIYTEKCHIVARFKDYLYYDDSTEFFNKFFQKNELYSTLPKIFNFYAKYCKVFPNYMILPENEFLYRNLRKKQKMIDQFNEIKKEEEENRKHLKLERNKNNENDYILFSKKIQDSIEKYRPSFTLSTIIMDDYINFGNTNQKKESNILNENSITISLNYNNTNRNNYDLNDINNSELSLVSIANDIGILTNEKYYNGNKLSFTPKKKQKVENFENEGKNNELSKKFISHYHYIKNSNTTNNNPKINTNNKINKKKEGINNNKINNLNNSTKKNTNNISQSKTSNNLFSPSISKTNKESNYNDISKKIQSNITKKKLFSATEKAIQHKKPIYHYNNKKLDKNSNSIISNKSKKNSKDTIAIFAKPSISPPNTKLNSLKLKFMNNIISKSKNLNNKTNILIYNGNNSNNLSYITKNKNKKSIRNNEKNKNNISKNKEDKKLNNSKKTIQEIMNNYKNILKNKKENHYSYDINKNNFFTTKNIPTNFTEKNMQINTSKTKNKKVSIYNKYISPGNKKINKINTKNPKTPLKPELKMKNKYQNIIIKTKEASQTKMKNFIKKIFDKNNDKNNFFINSKNP